MKTIQLTTAQAIVRFLKNQYVLRDGQETRIVQGVFGIFGHGNVTGLGQALEEMGGSELPFHQPKNEQSMVHTAIAFSKTRRGLGTYACTTSVGPGATNLVTGAATATINRLPVLLFPGDVFANRRPAPVLQQLEFAQSMDVSVNDVLRPVSRYWDRLNRPEQLLATLPEAMRHLATPELYGAVTLALPQDVQAESYDFPESFFEKRVYRISRRGGAAEEIQEAARMIRAAKRPLIIAGGGVFYSAAGSELQVWAESAHLPIGATQAGTSSFAPTVYSVGGVGVTGSSACNELAARADLVICVGTRLSDFTTASKTQFQAPGVKFLSINLNAFDAAKHGAFSLVGDARAILSELRGALPDYRISPEYEREIMARKESWKKTRTEITHTGSKSLLQPDVIRVLNETLDSSSTIVHAAGGLPGDLHKLWEPKGEGDYHSEYGYSCMGYEIAGALGVKFAEPTREVYAVLGDGSYLMLNHEIVTAVQEDKKITIIPLDNHGYQCIHGLQKAHGSLGFGNEFRMRIGGKLQGEAISVDYVANARSLGAATFTARTEPELIDSLKRARKEKGVSLIYIPLEKTVSLPGFSWWDVPVAESSAMSSVKEARAKYIEDLKKQTFYY